MIPGHETDQVNSNKNKQTTATTACTGHHNNEAHAAIVLINILLHLITECYHQDNAYNVENRQLPY